MLMAERRVFFLYKIVKTKKKVSQSELIYVRNAVSKLDLCSMFVFGEF